MGFGEFGKTAYKRTIFCSIGMTKDEEPKAFISVKEKDENGEHKILQYGSVEGILEGINLTSFDYNGKEIEQYDFILSDDNCKYSLKCAKGSMFARKVIERIASIETFDNPITIIPYVWKPENAGAKGYLSALVTCNGGDVRSKFALTEIPPVEKSTNDEGKTEYDSTARDKFFDFVVKEINKKINKIGDIKEEVPEFDSEFADEVPF